MSQKTNPTGLRLLKNNQNFSFPGFADFFFTENYHYGFEIENYISTFLRQTQYSKAFFSAQNQYRNFYSWLFLQDSRADKTEKQSFFKYKSFKKSQFLKNYSKLAVFRMLYNSQEQETKNLAALPAKQILHYSRFSRGDFVVDETISTSAKLMQDRHILNLLSEPNPLPYEIQLTKNKWYPDRKAALASAKLMQTSARLTHNQLQNRSTRNSQEMRGKESKETKRRWLRKNYLVVSLLFFCTRHAVRKYHRHLFFDLEKPICNTRRKSFFSDYYLLKNDFRKFVLNDFLYIKQSKRYSRKVGPLKEKVDPLKLRPKYSKQIGLKNATSITEFGSLAETMMQTISRSDLSSRAFNDMPFCNNFRTNSYISKADATRIDEKTKKTLKSGAPFNLVRVSRAEQVSNIQYFKTYLALDYCLGSLYSVFKPQNLDFAKQHHTQQNNLKVPTSVDFKPIRFIKDQQNVMSLLNQIVILLENRVSFRQIKSLVSKEFSSFSKHFNLKGLRIACSGRLGGRSKKAQKAKTQSANFGQTSLSAFSSKLIFGSQNAHTPSGLIGVKLWLCFKTTNF